jgi:hypothetical protein
VYDVTFAVDAPTAYTLSGMWTLGWDGVRSPSAMVQLTRVGDGMVLFSSGSSLGATPFLSDTLSASGTLAPGSYRFVASIFEDSRDPDNVLPQVTAQMQATLAFSVPSPGAAGVLALAVVVSGCRRRRTC